MKGTEKQVAWAADVQQAVIDTIARMLEETGNDPRRHDDNYKAQYELIRKKYERALEAVKVCDNAHDLIEVYQDVSPNNTYRDNMKAVASAIRNRWNCEYTPNQYKLIGE